MKTNTAKITVDYLLRVDILNTFSDFQQLATMSYKLFDWSRKAHPLLHLMYRGLFAFPPLGQGSIFHVGRYKE